VDEGGYCEVFAPVVLVRRDEAQELLDPLILSFRESVCLRVCGGREVPVDAEFFP
jgi:hypothetical protein